jgi:hypothetical protein
MARTFMVNTTNSFAGMVAPTVTEKLHRAKSIAELRHLYFEWREAVQLSGDGKKRLPDLETRLAALLS